MHVFGQGLDEVDHRKQKQPINHAQFCFDSSLVCWVCAAELCLAVADPSAQSHPPMLTVVIKLKCPMRPHLKAFVAAVVLVYFASNFGMLDKENWILQVQIYLLA